MSEARRYAIYFAAEDGSHLARFGRDWLEGDAGPRPDNWADLVRDASLYGFHATLKAPFRLAAGIDAGQLHAALSAFAAARAPFTEPPLVLTELSGFLALCPSRPSAALQALADACVRDFDRFRAPLSPAELARRLAAPLSERQRDLLEQWGYPHVFECFRFHMTLTRALTEDEREPVRALLAQRAAPALAEPLAVASIALFEQSAPGQPFALTRRFAFGGQS